MDKVKSEEIFDIGVEFATGLRMGSGADKDLLRRFISSIAKLSRDWMANGAVDVFSVWFLVSYYPALNGSLVIYEEGSRAEAEECVQEFMDAIVRGLTNNAQLTFKRLQDDVLNNSINDSFTCFAALTKGELEDRDRFEGLLRICIKHVASGCSEGHDSLLLLSEELGKLADAWVSVNRVPLLFVCLLITTYPLLLQANETGDRSADKDFSEDIEHLQDTIEAAFSSSGSYA